MPVDTAHPSFTAMQPRWQRMRNVLDGEDAVKAAGVEFLPMFTDQKREAYLAYKQRAQFLNATGRTHLSLKGFVFRKDPQVETPPELDAILLDCTLTGQDFDDVARCTTGNVLAVGRHGTLIEFNDDPQEPRPFIVDYVAENIINWRTARVAGQTVLTMLVLAEQDPEYYGTGTPTGDEFEHTLYDQWRVYRLIADEAGTPFVRIEIWRRKEPTGAENTPEFILINTLYPTRRSVPLDAIPFVFHGALDSQPEPGPIPLEDLALVNLSLYRSSADLENGRHFTGNPTPIAAGFEPKEGETFNVGSTVAWVTDNAQAKAYFLEFSGSGLTTLENACKEKKLEMAALGARLLQPESSKAEAYETVQMRHSSETSALQTLVLSCSQSLSDVLQWLAWWTGTAAKKEDLSEVAFVELNTEFAVQTLAADMVSALGTAYLTGAMSWQDYFWKMQQGEIFKPDSDPETARADIQSNPPGLPMPTDGNAGL